MYTIALLTHNGHIHPDRVSVSAQTRAHARAKSERLWANRGVCPQVESMHDSLRLCQPEWLGPWRFWICLGRSRDTSPPCTPPLPSPPRAPFPLQSETTIAPPSNAGGEDPTMARAPKPAHARTLGRAALGVQRIWHSADVFAPPLSPSCVRSAVRSASFRNTVSSRSARSPSCLGFGRRASSTTRSAGTRATPSTGSLRRDRRGQACVRTTLCAFHVMRTNTRFKKRGGRAHAGETGNGSERASEKASVHERARGTRTQGSSHFLLSSLRN